MSSGFDSLSEPDHGRSAMYRLQETLVSATQRILEADEADIDEAQLEEHVSAILPDVIDELSADVLSTIKEDAFSGGLEEVIPVRFTYDTTGMTGPPTLLNKEPRRQDALRGLDLRLSY